MFDPLSEYSSRPVTRFAELSEIFDYEPVWDKIIDTIPEWFNHKKGIPELVAMEERVIFLARLGYRRADLEEYRARHGSINNLGRQDDD